MIFNNNGTGLASNIPMAEGYDGSCGAALALVESARNDYTMFRAMLDVDAREYTIRQESAGYVTESRLQALSESAVSGIWNKIKELFNKLIAKVKSILHNFIARISGVFKDGKALVKKYGNEVLRKGNIDNLEVKWRKTRTADAADDCDDVIDDLDKLFTESDVANFAKLWDSDVDKRFNNVVKVSYDESYSATNMSEFREEFLDKFWEDDTPTTYTIKEIGGIRSIIEIVENGEKAIKKINNFANKLATKCNKAVRDANKYAIEKANDSRTKGDDNKYKATQNDVDQANHAYDCIVIYCDLLMALVNVSLANYKTIYAQSKAAFMKAVTVSNKKLDEATLIYADAVAEAAAEEVETVIAGALTSEELSDLCAASKNVKDSDVSNDQDELTYGPDCYTEPSNSPYSHVDGSIDASIVGRNESALFSNVVFK